MNEKIASSVNSWGEDGRRDSHEKLKSSTIPHCDSRYHYETVGVSSMLHISAWKFFFFLGCWECMHNSISCNPILPSNTLLILLTVHTSACGTIKITTPYLTSLIIDSTWAWWFTNISKLFQQSTIYISIIVSCYFSHKTHFWAMITGTFCHSA